MTPIIDTEKPVYSVGSNIAYIARHIWSQDNLFIPFTFLAALLQVAAPFIAIFLPKLVVDALTLEGAAREQVVGIILGSGLLLVLVNSARTVMQAWIEYKANRNRVGFMRLIEHKGMIMDYTHIENLEGQKAKTKATEAINSNQNGGEAIINCLSDLSQHLLGLLLYSSVVTLLSPWMMLVILITSLLGFFATRTAQKYEVHHRNEVATIATHRLYVSRQTYEFGNAKDLRLYGMSHWFLQHLDRFNRQGLLWRKRFLQRYFTADLLGDLLALLRDGLAYAYLITLVLQQAITPGDFVLYFAAIAGISNWMSQITLDLATLNRASMEIGYLRSFLDTPDTPTATPGAPIAAIAKPEIVFENVSFRYPGSENWILRDFNLRIAAGEKIALVGVNGAGKTTCIKLLCGLYRPTEGRILVDGVDIAAYNRDNYFKLFSVVFQEVRTLALSLRQNVALCVDEEMDIERVRHCLSLAGMNDMVAALPQGEETPLTRVLDDSGVELSGGQAQKLMLARALYKDAPIIIMDEPTAALDPIAEAELYERYNEMVGAKTSIYISHRLSSTRFCDRIAFIKDGNVSELGSHEELMHLQGDYARMFSVQAHYYQKELKEGN